jgi:hypothetical protein
VRVCVRERRLRHVFTVVGVGAPFLAGYILYKALTSDEVITVEERAQINDAEDEIERLRLSSFGGKFPFRAKIKIQYIRTLDKTAETLERISNKLAA